MDETNKENLTLEEFDYQLPEEMIARHPVSARDHSRLLVLERASGQIRHRHFYQLGDYLRAGDLLVLNDSRVIPARLIGQRYPHGGKVEFLLVRELEPGLWRVMVRPGKKIHLGDRVIFAPRRLEASVLEYGEVGERVVRFSYQGEWWQLLEEVGHTPLPPYILNARRDFEHTRCLEEKDDRERYQTIFARYPGSVAAPTAGLHFTPQLMRALENGGIEFAFITLHIGPGTFKPVSSAHIEEHRIEPEWFRISREAAEKINRARKDKRRILAVGSTPVRALETVANEEGLVRPGESETSLMILPGYRFKCVQAMLSNFHLPRSTLLMMVCALASATIIHRAYQEAIREGYRFYSYGDAMLIA